MNNQIFLDKKAVEQVKEVIGGGGSNPDDVVVTKLNLVNGQSEYVLANKIIQLAQENLGEDIMSSNINTYGDTTSSFQLFICDGDISFEDGEVPYICPQNASNYLFSCTLFGYAPSQCFDALNGQYQCQDFSFSEGTVQELLEALHTSYWSSGPYQIAWEEYHYYYLASKPFKLGLGVRIGNDTFDPTTFHYFIIDISTEDAISLVPTLEIYSEQSSE